MYDDTDGIRTVYSGLTEDCAEDFLSRILDQMANGLWANDLNMKPYWMNAEVSTDEKGRVYIGVNEKGASPYKRMGNSDVRHFFADTARKIYGIWKIENTQKSIYVTWLSKGRWLRVDEV